MTTEQTISTIEAARQLKWTIIRQENTTDKARGMCDGVREIIQVVDSHFLDTRDLQGEARETAEAARDHLLAAFKALALLSQQA